MRLINPEVRIENSSQCNANCVICPRDKMTRPKVMMDNDHFFNLVDQSKGLGAETISIFGYGEPLMDWNIVKKVKYCSDSGLKTFITTNASLLNVNLASDLIEAGLSSIRFSVHGTFGTYEKVHRGLDFQTTIRNLGNFRAIARGRCKTSVSVIPINNEDIESIKLLYKNFDLEIWRPHNWTDGREYREITKERKITCGRPFRGPVQINADGKMMVCCFDYNAVMTIGDTYKDSIETILKTSAELERIKKAHTVKSKKGLICETCDQLNVGGQSPLIFSTVDDSLDMDKTSSTKFKLL